jgi:hypothetical protein
MGEVRSIEWIKADAKAAWERWEEQSTAPTNPFATGTHAHKVWAGAYYTHSTKDRAAQAA